MIRKIITFRLLFILALLCGNLPVNAIGWVDSAIADLTRQMIRAQFLAAHTNTPEQLKEQTSGQQSRAFNIVIDLAKWQPIVSQYDSAEFFFFKSNASVAAHTFESEFNYQDSINAFNQQYLNHPNYVAYYNVVLDNFPFNLTKDVSSTNFTIDNTLYNQLTQLKAVKNEDWNDAVAAFESIIKTATENVKFLFNRQRVLVFGSCALTGFYGPKRISKIKFYLTTIQHTAELDSESWREYLYQIPKRFKTPGIKIDNFQEKNRDVALGIQYYLACNLYNNCQAGSNIFANRQARWLHENLSNSTTINKNKLFTTCLELNSISEFRAWQVLMAGHDDQMADMNSPVNFVYTGTTNAALDKIILRVQHIKRADKVLKDAGSALSRDSVLYYGYLMHRDNDYWKAIVQSRRIGLMETLLNGTCLDYGSISDANDPDNFCEILVLLLFENLPAGEERNFLLQLHSKKILAKLSYRLDNQTVGYFGGDNYTRFIIRLCKYWRDAFPEKYNSAQTAPSTVAIFVWDDDFFNQNSWITTNLQQNQILADQKQTGARYAAGSPEMQLRTFDVYDPVLVHTLNENQLLGLPAGRTLMVPAIFMDWLSQKKAWSDAGTATQVIVATIGVAFGVSEIYFAANATMRGVGILLTAVNTGELLLLNNSVKQAVLGCFSTPQEGQEFIESYHHIVMILNVAVIGRDLFTDFYSDLRAFRLSYQAKQPQLSAALGANSVEMRALEELNEAIVAEEGALGVAESAGAGNTLFKVDESLKSADEIAGVLVNGLYRLNPTAKNVTTLVKNPSGTMKLDQSANSILNGKYMYVIDETDNIIIGTRSNGFDFSIPDGKAPHPTLIGGADPTVKTAGIIEFRGGKIYKIDNISGHYKPSSQSLQNAQPLFYQIFSANNFADDFQGFIPFTN